MYPDHMFQVIASIIYAVPSVLALITARRVKAQVDEVKAQVLDIHLSMNSRMDEMLKLAKAAAHAEGITEGMATGAATESERHSAAAATAMVAQVAQAALDAQTQGTKKS